MPLMKKCRAELDFLVRPMWSPSWSKQKRRKSGIYPRSGSRLVPGTLEQRGPKACPPAQAAGELLRRCRSHRAAPNAHSEASAALSHLINITPSTSQRSLENTNRLVLNVRREEKKTPPNYQRERVCCLWSPPQMAKRLRKSKTLTWKPECLTTRQPCLLRRNL